MSIGRDLTFQLDVAREKSADECVKDITIKFQIPGDNGPVLQEETFKCGKTNFGVFQQDLTVYQNPVPKGRWVYQIEKDERVSISVKVTSKSADQSSDPILTKCWIATGSQEINSEQDLKLSVVADVRQGNKPVIGAKVKAIVERPPNANNEPQPEMELELVDNGSGADFIKNDGIYSRYELCRSSAESLRSSCPGSSPTTLAEAGTMSSVRWRETETRRSMRGSSTTGRSRAELSP